MRDVECGDGDDAVYAGQPKPHQDFVPALGAAVWLAAGDDDLWIDSPDDEDAKGDRGTQNQQENPADLPCKCSGRQKHE